MKSGTKMMGWVAAMVMGLMSSQALAAKHPSKKEVTGVVNLNTATPQQLDILPGVGPSAAQRIVEYRHKTPFAKIEDLRRVKGFGAKKFQKLKPHLAVSGATTAELKTREEPQGASENAPTVQGRRATPK